MSRTTVQRITEVERGLEVNKDKFKAFGMKVSKKFKNRKFSADRSISQEDWKELVDNDEAFTKRFENIFDNPDVSYAEDLSPDNFYVYGTMEISMDRSGAEPQLSRVVKKMKDNEGNTIGMANKNPILDTRVYWIEFQDGFRQPLAVNLISENLFAQVDQEVRKKNLINMIINVNKTDEDLKDKDAFDISSNGTKRRKATTNGWKVSIQWKGRSTTWNTLKDVKYSFPIELSEYSVENWIASKPAFTW